MRGRREIVSGLVLAIAMLLAAWLRFENLGGPSFWLDEILGQMHAHDALRLPWWQWLSGFHPEHGPLYYATIVTATDEWSARLAPALFGLATVMVVWLAAREVSSDELPAACAAVIVAVSPLHVYYSREARPYGLVILLTSAVLLALLRRTWGLAPLLLLMLYTSTATASVIATVMVLGLVLWVMDRRARYERPVPDGSSPFDGRVQNGSSGDLRRTLRGARPFFLRFRWLRAGALHHRLICFAPPAQATALSAAFLAMAALVFIPLLYRRGDAAAPPPVPFPPIDLELFDRLIRGMAVTVLDSQAGGRTAYGLFALAVVGAVVLLRKNRVAGVIVVGFTLLPAAIALTALRVAHHWYAVRYVSPSVIGFAILAACGLVAVAGVPATLLKSRQRSGEVVTMLLVVAILATIAAETWTLARREPQRKLDWRGIAQAIWNDAHEGDLVLAAEPWSELSLRYYMQKLPRRVTLMRAQNVENAKGLVARFPSAWLVTAGFTPDASVRQWMCSQPMLMAGSFEGFRLHYAPSAQHYLTARAGAAELRAASAAIGREPLRIRMSEDSLFAAGWAMVEGERDGAFRWAVGRSSTIVLPRSERVDRIVRIRVSPLDAPRLPPQTLQLSVNGTATQSLILTPGWHDHAIETAAAAWTDGWNVLTFVFGRANAPTTLDPASRDDRQLAAAFAGIAIEQRGMGGAVARDATRPSARFASAALLQDAFWDDYKTRFAAGELRRKAVEPLLGRLGFDPVDVWPRLASGSMHLEDVLEVAAYGTDCMDDEVFLTRTAALLLERELSAWERADLLRAMREDGYTRQRIAVRIGRADEFRVRMLGSLKPRGAV